MTSMAMTGRRFDGHAMQAAASSSRSQNLGELEKTLSMVGGGLLALYGITRPWPGGLLLTAIGAGLFYRGTTGHCDLYQAMGISTATPRGPATSVPAGQGVKVVKAIVVSRAPHDVYRFWRNLSNLPRFMNHIRSVTVQGNRSHWVARGPMGMNLEWDAQIINDEEPSVIAWRSLPGADVDSAGSVHFTPEPGGRGTRVTVSLKYDPPAGRVGATLAQWFGETPESQIEEDLRRFKQIVEAGEVASTHGQPAARWRQGFDF